MEKITMADIQDNDGLRLNHKLLYRLDDSLIEERRIPTVAALLDALDGSRVGLWLIPYEDRSATFLQLRCGEFNSGKAISMPEYLDRVNIIDLAPFLAVCAGKEQDETEPTRLEQLERRVKRLEGQLGISDAEE